MFKQLPWLYYLKSRGQNKVFFPIILLQIIVHYDDDIVKRY
jgi:hypothetical protein